MGADVDGFEPGGGRPEGIVTVLTSVSAGGVAFQGIDMGPDSQDGAGPLEVW